MKDGKKSKSKTQSLEELRTCLEQSGWSFFVIDVRPSDGPGESFLP